MLAELILWIYGSREFIGFQFSVPRVSSAWIISVPIVCVKKWQKKRNLGCSRRCEENKRAKRLECVFRRES